MFTIFSIPKPFEGHIGVIQRNAIRSWLTLHPKCEVILCGNGGGIEEAAKELGTGLISDIECTEYGTPLLSSVFSRVAAAAVNRVICYANCDIILLSDFVESLRRVPLGRFLVVGQRWNLDLKTPWNFDAHDSEARLRALISSEGSLHPPAGSDYFAFSVGSGIENLPPFAVGRAGWDNWMISNALKLQIPVIDASKSITVVHQNHDYAHVPQRRGDFYEGPESDMNIKLLQSEPRATLAQATHDLVADVVKIRLQPPSHPSFKRPLRTAARLGLQWARHISVAMRSRLKIRTRIREAVRRIRRTSTASRAWALTKWNTLPVGHRPYECPFCELQFRRLLPSTAQYSIRGQMLDHSVKNSACPACTSGIRHRFIFSFLKTVLRSEDKSVLHFAPEPGFYKFFKQRAGIDYMPCDIEPQHGSDWKKIDITSIASPSERFDLIVCVHVLEHIVEDRQAIAELYRVTKPNGRLILAVPTYGETTYEDDTLDESGRRRMFGIADHRRLNGLDLKYKLAEAGYKVTVVSIDDVPGNYLDRTARSPHIDSDKYLFFCEKPAHRAASAA